jgi:biotin carboxyl carrier protein
MARRRKAAVAAVKLRIEVYGESHMLELRGAEYIFDNAAGSASIEEVMPGVFSILLGSKSFTVNVAARGDAFEALSGDGPPRLIAVADTRDRRGSGEIGASKGPAIIRAQMPGKIIKVLVAVGAQVEAGQGLIVVEAMKMQNEVKAPKSGVVMKISTTAGATVAAGETLIVVE